MFPTVSVRNLHHEYRLWMNELAFAKEEIRHFEKKLADVLRRHRSVTVTAPAEHFQNQFIRHKEVIDELRHRLHGSEVQLATFAREMSGMGLEMVRMDNHVKLRDEMMRFRQIYSDLKGDFRRFEAGSL